MLPPRNGLLMPDSLGTRMAVDKRFWTGALAVATVVIAGASAQSFSGDVIAQCNQSVGQMKFEGWPADRNREMMMLSCEQNGGVVPGTFDQRPVSLPRNAPQR